MSDHESNGMSKRDQSPIYRTPLRGTIVSSLMPQSGVFNTSSSLMRTPPVDLRRGANPFQKGKSMPRKKDDAPADATGPYKNKKDVMRDYDPTLYEEVYGGKATKMSKAYDPRGPRAPKPNMPRVSLEKPSMMNRGTMAPRSMMKGDTCAQCGSKFTKRGMCKCGTMGKVQKGWKDTVKDKAKDLATQGFRAAGRAIDSVPTGRSFAQETQYNRSQSDANRMVAAAPAKARPFVSWAESQGHKGSVRGSAITERGNSATNRSSFVNPQIGSKNSGARKMAKGARTKAMTDAGKWVTAAPMMEQVNAKTPMVIEQKPSGAILGTRTSAKPMGSRNSSARKMAKGDMCKCGSGMSKAECNCKMSKSQRPMPPGIPGAPGRGRLPIPRPDPKPRPAPSRPPLGTKPPVNTGPMKPNPGRPDMGIPDRPMPMPDRGPTMRPLPVKRPNSKGPAPMPMGRMGKGQGAYIDGAKAKVTKRSR